MSISVFTTSSIHCILHLNFESNPFSSNWVLVHTVIPRDEDTHLEMKVESEEFPHALENENQNETMHADVVFPHTGLLKI